MKSTKYAVAFLAVTILLVVPATVLAAPRAPAAAATQITVNGTVAEQGTGTPIVGATVVVSVLDNKGVWQLSATLSSGAGGAWTYGGKTGSYRFAVSAPSADSVTLDRDYPARGTYALAVELASYGAISGTVSDSATGLPLGGATVEFFAALPGGGWASAPAASAIAADGAYTSPQLRTGTYAVEASAAGYSDSYFGGAAPMAVTVTRAATTPAIDIALALEPPQTATISGRLMTASGAGMPGFVYLFRQNADGTWPAYVGFAGFTRSVEVLADGNYTLTDVALGTYRVRLFNWHQPTQWWLYQSSYETAQSLVLDAPGQVVTGINAIFPPPTP